MDNKKKQFAISVIRRASYRHPGRYTALKDARVGRNQYKCSMCSEDKIHPKKNIQLDHIESVVPVEGWTNFDDYIDRMYVSKEGYQVLCKEHHEEKTLKENELRKQFKGSKIIKSLCGKNIIVDESDYDYLVQWNWGINSSGYARRTHYNKNSKLQKTLMMHKELTETDNTQIVDHINGNKLDNRRSNLRIVNQSVNTQRKKTKRKVYDIPYFGIDYDPKVKKYFVRLIYNKIRFNFGGFEDPKTAAVLYDKAALFFYGEHSRVNFEHFRILFMKKELTKKQLKAELIEALNNRLYNNLNSQTKKSAEKQLNYLITLDI